MSGCWYGLPDEPNSGDDDSGGNITDHEMLTTETIEPAKDEMIEVAASAIGNVNPLRCPLGKVQPALIPFKPPAGKTLWQKRTGLPPPFVKTNIQNPVDATMTDAAPPLVKTNIQNPVDATMTDAASATWQVNPFHVQLKQVQPACMPFSPIVKHTGMTFREKYRLTSAPSDDIMSSSHTSLDRRALKPIAKRTGKRSKAQITSPKEASRIGHTSSSGQYAPARKKRAVDKENLDANTMDRLLDFLSPNSFLG